MKIVVDEPSALGFGDDVNNDITLKNTNEEINEIAAVVRTAVRNASYAINGLACAKSVRKRCEWRKDLRSCKAKLDRASYNLMLALSSGEATGWIAEDAGKTLEHAGKYIDLLSA